MNTRVNFDNCLRVYPAGKQQDLLVAFVERRKNLAAYGPPLTPAMNPIKIAIVENHTLLREWLVGFIDGLNHHFRVIVAFSTGTALLNYLRTDGDQTRPDIVLTGYQMPGLDGYELTSWIKKRFPDIKVIVLSNQHDDVVVVRLIKAGISSYLVKSVDGDEILAALEAVADGDTYFKGLDWNTITELPDGEPVVRTWYGLSDIEKEYVKLCISDRNESELAAEIRKQLRDHRYVLEYPITKVYEKFGVKSRIGLVLLVARYRLLDLHL